MTEIIIIVVAVFIIFVTFLTLISRYKRCPSDKILVIYGRTGGTSAKCVHGGGAFIWPVIQDYQYLDLKPLSIEANLTNALSRQNIRVDVPCRFTIAISTETESMNTAAERLLGLSPEQIQELAKDILFGQLRLVIATMTIEEINSDRDKFLDNISKNVDSELRKIGLKLINVNVTDIKDESGYIEALGKEAAAKAINEAKISVAEQEKIGETGKAMADREKDVQIAETHRDRDVKIAITNKDREVSIAAAFKDESIGKAEAQRDTRVKTSEANAIAIKGENEARIAIAQSEAARREREAEALRTALASEKVQSARALEESYVAEQKAEEARAERERSTQNANIVIPAQIAKQKAIIDAQAEAEKTRELAKGEADAIFAKMEAEAKGLYEILTKQAEGYKEVVAAAGGDPTKAFQLLLIEKLPELVKTQVEAVKNIKIDKITVWDSGNNGDNGAGSTANFVSGMMKTVPPLNDLFNMAGLNLPTYLKGEDKIEPTTPDTTDVSNVDLK
ncbi:MAG: flotillin family protein [Flavobacteriaceae bacterium]|uniref:Flotillin family protein n=1 Tax=Flavobacterium kayseriense TaxID=2764714 RepID=A0ABR7J5T7_9FLAO|nr:flotillin family protein [Flavobacterium kayseriense]MBC5840888.1 flotillin family protein [Flavobacterium kayseriense]MBC5846443.1 flotillin family protein [Flavobacterium kayseriense]MBX9886354.1 flotillin family protein [Flavobacteriaceae bacterium]